MLLGVSAEFETFTRRAAPVVREPVVALQRRGVLSLNRAAYELLGEPATVELLFDRTGRRIGIRPIASDAPHAYRVRKQPGSATYLVAAKAFMQFYGIPNDQARRYDADLVDGVLVAELRQDHGEQFEEECL